jgi:hypothetical protein
MTDQGSADVGSGGLALVAAPAQAIAIAVPADGAIRGAENLFFSNRVGDFTSGEKKQMDQENAKKNGGQNKCTECAQDVHKVQNKKGEPAPGNQLQRHHDPPLSKGGNSKSPKNRIVCKNCHLKIHAD